MDDPILFWTLLAVIAANIILVALAIANALRLEREIGWSFSSFPAHGNQRKPDRILKVKGLPTAHG
jgi:hypothetical protein